MRACFGVLDLPLEASQQDRITQLTQPEVAPIPGGLLFFFSSSRYELAVERLCELTRDYPNHRYILTLGDYNEGLKPDMYEHYARFAAATSDKFPGSILLCTQSYMRLSASVRMNPDTRFLPLCVAVLLPLVTIPTAFGNLEPSEIWYSRSNVQLVLPHEPIENMTSGSELDFWYSPFGFLYLAHQYLQMRVHKNRPRRVVVYSDSDINSERFLKFLFTLEAMHVDLLLLYQDDLRDFNRQHRLGDLKLFSRVGTYAFVVSGETPLFSDSPKVARDISDALAELREVPGAYNSLGKFMETFSPYMSPALSDRASWTRRGRLACDLMERFYHQPLAAREAVLETYIERWRSL